MTETVRGDDPPVEAISDPQEIAYRALHDERAALEQELTLAQQRQRFDPDARAAEEAQATEATLLKDLDRILTLIRAAEIRRSQPQARRWQ
ncbi:hypothetical protein [Methylobacterium sp. Leaf118]|uniref:hypothetical protein n=1 Tax=Methylobacterium sp. Leaf118 TaxID=2876562 RepID=UPI001E334AA3|nr:hypothetical protein [Methylobacterium sp. Leaf118]